MSKAQEVTFNRVIKWLQELNFTIENEKRLSSTSEITFYCEVKPFEKREDFFKVMFPKQLEDCFLLESTIILEADYMKFIESTRNKEQRQLFIDIRKAVYPLGISIDTKRKKEGQLIILHKVIYFDTLNSKQHFSDYIFNIVNAMLLVSMVIDEFRNSVNPKGSPGIT